MKGAIIANGECLDIDFLRTTLLDMDYIICLDGGLNYCEKLGINPDIIAGDFDSVDPLVLKRYETLNIEIRRYPARKDWTDMEIGIDIAKERGIDELFILNALGRRLDHTLGNLGNMLLALEKGLKPVILDKYQDVYVIDDKIALKRPVGTVVSLVPITVEAKGVKTRGLDYPLDYETLYVSRSRGISNVFVEEEAEISIREGKLLILINTVN